MTPTTAKKLIRAKGYGWRRAATALGYSYTNVSHILTGRRPVSQPFIARLLALPPSAIPHKRSGFAAK